jgi:hypothetical protein
MKEIEFFSSFQIIVANTQPIKYRLKDDKMRYFNKPVTMVIGHIERTEEQLENQEFSEYKKQYGVPFFHKVNLTEIGERQGRYLL